MLSLRLLFGAILCAALISPITRAEDKPPAPRADSKPRLLRKLVFGDYGSKYIRMGDLDGDGAVDLLLVQGNRHNDNENRLFISCLTALDLEGNILWQTGKPDPANTWVGSDYAVQIYDLDGDGANEVVYIADEQNILTVAEGKTGKTIKTAQLAGGHDSILFLDFAGVGRATDMVVKDRYKNFWVYDKDLRLQWTKRCNTGHFPIEFDFDGDGHDELLCGYALYDRQGRELWNHDEFPQHNDAAEIADVDGDGQAEIALASSENAYLLDAAGKILMMRPMGHCQHALIGKFRLDLPGKQIFYLDRRADSTNYQGKKLGDFDRSQACMVTPSGELLWSNKDHKWWAAGLKVDRWTANPDENFVLMYSRGYRPPGLFDGHGREIATFPFDEGIIAPGGGPDGQDLYDDELAQHISCWGDEREEILIFNEKALRIYTNAALFQRPRMYNNNFYPGRL